MEPTVIEPASIKKQNWVYPTGYLLLAVSFLIFIAVDQLTSRRDDNLMFFFIHYFIAWIYAVLLITIGALGIRKSWSKDNIDKTAILLNLFLISAYSLNRQIPVFEDSTDWFCAFVGITSVTILSYRFFNLSSLIVKYIQSYLLGIALVLYIYYVIYVSNFYIMGTLGTILFGIGAHIFVPIFLVTCVISLIKHYHQKSIHNYVAGLGVASAFLGVAIFTTAWNSRIKSIERTMNQSVLNRTDLPTWVTIAQSIKVDWITERILKSDLVYTVANDHLHWDFFSMNSLWAENKKHDPLVFIASLFSKTSLSKETRIDILQAITDNRHRAQERLWEGDNLTTSYVVSDVDIYPGLRLAYTEKYLTIRNNSTRRSWWGSREEAIYTFQLPEGSVVTSLSLWINGKEEKSILTSKHKADSAYKTIVGVENRDPSVVHWHEGNTVSVRVFPCTDKEERKFKIGITSPLPEKDGRIIYNNMTFKGPNPASASATVRLRFIGEPSHLEIPEGFKKNKKGDYFLEQAYDTDLSISFDAMPIKQNQFSFDGFAYSLALYKPDLRPTQIDKVYLDVNKAWTSKELEALKPLLNSRSLFVYEENELIKLTHDNWSEVTNDLLNQNFSLFPFYMIKDVEHSLVITKGKELTPHLSDIKESLFADKVSQYFSSQPKAKVFNLDGGLSNYIGSFRELRGLEFAKGTTDQLLDLIHRNQFPITNESDQKIILHDSQMTIHKTIEDSALNNNAPDHLARLFAYNDIMRKIGGTYFKKDFINEDLVKEAGQAYVVSPVSSLIVLESQKDYNRFGIKDTDNSLHNAAKQSSGAVPEPHEWALIIIFVGLVVYATIQKFCLQR